jgi:hypothetical protein
MTAPAKDDTVPMPVVDQDPGADGPLTVKELREAWAKLAKNRGGYQKQPADRFITDLLDRVALDAFELDQAVTQQRVLEGERNKLSGQVESLAARVRAMTGDGPEGLAPDAEHIAAVRQVKEQQQQLDAERARFTAEMKRTREQWFKYCDEVEEACKKRVAEAEQAADQIVTAALDPNGLPVPTSPDELARRRQLVVSLTQATFGLFDDVMVAVERERQALLDDLRLSAGSSGGGGG